MSKPKVLVAGTPAAIETVQQLLGSDVETVPARSLDAALRSLDEHPDVIVCNVRFDESRMMDLLEAAKARPDTRDTPFLCLRLAPSPPSWRRLIEVAILSLGAVGLFDFSSLERDSGRDAAERALRDTVLSQLRH